MVGRRPLEFRLLHNPAADFDQWLWCTRDFDDVYFHPSWWNIHARQFSNFVVDPYHPDVGEFAGGIFYARDHGRVKKSTRRMKSTDKLTQIRVFLIISSGLALVLAVQYTRRFMGMGVPFAITTPVWFLTILIALIGLGELVLLGISWTQLRTQLLSVLETICSILYRSRLVAIGVGILSLGIYPLLVWDL